MALRMARGRAVCRESVGRAEQSNPKPQRKRSKEEVAKAMVRPSPTPKQLSPRKNAKLGQAKEERQDKYLHFRLGFRRSHGRDAGRRGSSPRVRAGIGVKILVFGVF
jgi:hypothetical protein